jgi:hypothetical protein
MRLPPPSLSTVRNRHVSGDRLNVAALDAVSHRDGRFRESCRPLGVDSAIE